MFPYKKILNVKSPTRGTNESAGLDFYVPEDQGQIVIKPRKDALINSGLCFIIPHGYALIGFNKSGISTIKKLVVGACVVDSDYRGPVHIHLFNESDNEVTLNPGDKIAQFIKIKVDYEMPSEISVEEFDKLSKLVVSCRGENGFGHSG